MNKQYESKIISILNSEMVLATGCTEPAAIAYAAAVAAKHLKGGAIETISISASGNIIKNAMAAGIPGTYYTGVAYAAAIGAIGGDPEKGLQVISDVGKKAYSEAEDLVKNKKVEVKVSDTSEKLYIDVTVHSCKNSARAVISGMHTNIVLIFENGKKVYESKAGCTAVSTIGPDEIASTLSIEKIYKFADDVDVSSHGLDIIRQSISVNSKICTEGLKNDYGLKIGKLLNEELKDGVIGRDMVSEAVCVTSAGADARMAGAPMGVVSNSGSGNQGITATMPVVAAAEWMDSGNDKTIRAVTLSNLVAIYIKSKFGRLSALCGATVAATGASCGITYLLGGSIRELGYAIQNMMGNVAGMLCDGAKADCALKISTCTSAAMQAAFMAIKGVHVRETDGIVDSNVEKTIDNFTLLGSKGSLTMDSLVLDIMLNKTNSNMP